MINFIPIDNYDEEKNYNNADEFHAVFTATLGELIHDGLVDFNDGSWDALEDGTKILWYNEEQKKRLYSKIKYHYYWREIGELPYSRWKMDFLITLAEIMPKYNFIYAALDNDVSFMQLKDEYGKNRNIYSEFPQTRLADNEDYASTGNDNQHETITDGNFIEMVKKLRTDYNDPDLLIINELDKCFYCVLSSNINGL